MNLEQALEISRLSTAPSDECTWAPEFGVGHYCVLHDHLLQHFVFFRDDLNLDQIRYMLKQHLYEHVIWAQSRGTRGTELTWKDVNHLFREGLQEKIHTENGLLKKIFYWLVRNLYYIAVVGRHKIQRYL